VYALGDTFLTPIMCDSRETVPLTIGLFLLAGGEVDRAVTYCANFGRDADTIASMCGAIAGAFRGATGIKKSWVEKAMRLETTDQRALADHLVGVALSKSLAEQQARARLERLERR
jgi:ADP-ribosylglycohydrolase